MTTRGKYNDPVTPASDLLRELSERDPDEVVDLLNVGTTDLIRAFPQHVLRYIRSIQSRDIELMQSWNDDGEELEEINLDDIGTEFGTLRDEEAEDDGYQD